VSAAYVGSLRAGVHQNGIGSRVGPVFIVDADKDVFATLHCNPPVIRLADGSYKQRGETDISNTCITAMIETPDAKDRQATLAELVAEFPHLSERIMRELKKAGLGRSEI
jgi:hypothetical protein